MKQKQQEQNSHLFTLRLWPEALGGGRSEWRGQVRHVTSGETRYFRDWDVLIDFVRALLPELDGEDSTDNS